ncbi:hypothetical protein H9N28_11565 [Rhodobacter capsulatus]|uniref:hypothetical protein n=1 Tax=Rhodobacter capsulatus TaxID=1061 RepID=UPI0011BD0550|nr:hypothetical protein [Rhodobacter capsulatus]QNR62219.1 hypothetical protein H9N28_11565 [Rhodobacter capsulatus]
MIEGARNPASSDVRLLWITDRQLKTGRKSCIVLGSPAVGVYAHDWYQFHQGLTNRALREAQRVACALAEAEPTAPDLIAAPILQAWIGVRDIVAATCLLSANR